MALANCSRCGALFNKLTLDYCKDCYDQEETLLRETQEYLRKNRNAAMFEVIDNIDLEQWMLEKWINEKRITLNDPLSVKPVPRCSSCGRETKPGQQLCKTCQLKKLSKKPAEKTLAEVRETPTRSSGMHYKTRT